MNFGATFAITDMYLYSGKWSRHKIMPFLFLQICFRMFVGIKSRITEQVWPHIKELITRILLCEKFLSYKGEIDFYILPFTRNSLPHPCVPKKWLIRLLAGCH